MKYYEEMSKKLVDGYYNNHPGEYYDDMRNYIMQRLPTDNQHVAGRIFSNAWEDGHSYGYHEVFLHINDLITLIHDIDMIRKKEIEERG